MRTASKILALAIIVLQGAPSTAFAGAFSRYLDDAPDYVIEQAFQYDSSGTFFVRVCNNGSTPTAGGSLRIAIGRSASDKEERYFSNVMPAGGSCSNFDLTNIRSFGTRADRTYPLNASVAWSGFQTELSTKNNSKSIPASATSRTTGSWSAPATSWSNTPVRTTSTDPARDLYSDWNPKNPYAGRTWYYPSTSVCYNQSYSNGYGYRYDSNYNTYYNGYRPYNGSYYDSTGCNGNYPFAPGTSGYYWPGVSTNSYDRYPDIRYSPTTDSYFNYSTPSTGYYAQSEYSLVNFYIARIGRDGNYRNVLATLCNDGADMSQFQDVTVELKNQSKGTSFRSTQYIRLLSGQCRDISVAFSSFSIDFTGYYTFRANVDPDNRIMERNKNDNALETNVWIEK